MLCIAAKPDSAAPITTRTARQAQRERRPVKASSRNGATSTDSAKSRPWGRKPRREAMASAPSSAPSPSAATSAPSHSGPDAQHVAREDRQHVLVREEEHVHQHRDDQHRAHGGLAPGLAKAGAEARDHRGGVAAARAADAGGEADEDEQAERVERGDRHVARRGAEAREPDAGQHRPDHLGDLHRDGLERHRAGHTARAHERVERGAPGREVERPERAEEHLEADHRPEAAPARPRRPRPGPARHQPQRLGEDEHAPAVHAVRHQAGERAQQHHRRRAGERGHRHHERRVGELEGEPAEQDEVHPARAVDAETRRARAGGRGPRGGSRRRRGGGQAGRRRSDAAHPRRDSTEHTPVGAQSTPRALDRAGADGPSSRGRCSPTDLS